MIARPHRRRRHGCSCGLVLAAAGLLLPGCYEHVVRASGPGASRMDVYEPNLKRVPVVDEIEEAVTGRPRVGPLRQPTTRPRGR